MVSLGATCGGHRGADREGQRAVSFFSTGACHIFHSGGMAGHAKGRRTTAAATRPVAPSRRQADLAMSWGSASGAVDLASIAAPAEVDGHTARRRAASKVTQGSHHRRPRTVGFSTRSFDPWETSPLVITVAEDQGLLRLVLTFLSAVDGNVAELRGEGGGVGEPWERRFYGPVGTARPAAPRRARLRRGQERLRANAASPPNHRIVDSGGDPGSATRASSRSAALPQRRGVRRNRHAASPRVLFNSSARKSSPQSGDSAPRSSGLGRRSR